MKRFLYIVTSVTITLLVNRASAGWNGTCNPTVNDEPLLSAPTGYLCFTGTPSSLSGSRPWRWTCAGANGGSTASCQTVAPPPTSNAYYVSPNGNDYNNGLSPTTPFRTLERAQAFMQASLTIKTVYLMGGTYSRSQTLSITRYNDAGESWIAYPGQTPILDGGNGVAVGVAITGNNIRVQGLTVQNYTQTGIYAYNAQYAVINNNTIQNIHSSNTNQGGIYALYFHDSKITHNLVQNVNGPGIILSSQGEDNSNVIIDSNKLINVNATLYDSGGIYVLDRAHVSKSQLISNNAIRGFGGACPVPTGSYPTNAILLDDQTSFVTVRNNIMAGNGGRGAVIHGGDHNSFMNNIFDATNYCGEVLLYQDVAALNEINYGMAGNVISNNIVYSTGNKKLVWSYLSAIHAPVPTVYQNLYYSINGFLFPAPIIDTSPATGNPGFANPSQGDYTLTTNFATTTIWFQPLWSNIGPQ